MPFNGGGFGRAGGDAQPQLQILTGGLGDSAALSQAAGVAQYGDVWASKNCASCNTAILEMQGLLNRVAYALSVPGGLSSDGKVGPATVRTIQAIAQAMMARGAPVGMVLGSFGTPEAIAKSADTIRDLLRALADSIGAPTTGQASAGSGGAPMPNPTGNATTPTMTVVQQGGGLMPTTGMYPVPATIPATGFAMTLRSKWPWFVGGGLLFVGVVTAIVIVAKPPQARA